VEVMMAKPVLDEVELLAAIEALKRVSPEEQEAAIRALEEEHPGVGTRARALLELEKQTAEAVRKLEARAAKEREERERRAAEITGKLEAEPPTGVVAKLEPAKSVGGWRFVQRADGSKWMVRGNDWRRHFGPVPQLRVVEQARPKPEPVEAKKPEPEEPKPEQKPVAVVQHVAKGKVSPLGFQHSKNPVGIPASLENAIKAIDNVGAECRYDVFHDRIIVRGHECGVRGDAHENLENVTLKVRQAVLERFGFDPAPTFTLDALRLRCLDHIFDPVRDYLDGLRWDGVKRIDGWLVKYCRAKDTPLNRAVGRKMLIAAVRRVKEPGCKFDYIVVLEGDQGIGKSSVLKILAGEDNFSDNEILGLQKREQQEAIQGVWIYEVAELEGLGKSEVTKVKLFASKTYDSARPAYGRTRVDRPRRCIFVATTNENTYLRDTTGNRRFWPVSVGVIDLAAVKRDRDQLWAEAVAMEAGGEPLVIPERVWPDVAIQQEARMELDPWEDQLSEKLGGLMRNDFSFVRGPICRSR
jgi:hypothetical protein